MDTDVADQPLQTPTVGSACQALISSVQKTAMDITAFVRRCRPARADLAPTTRELSELRMVLELLDDHASQVGGGGADGQGGEKGAIPEELQTHLRPILTNCITAVLRLDAVLRQQQHGSEEGKGALRWTAQGRDEIRELEKSLGVYRGVLALVSDLVSILVSSGKEEGGSGESISAGGTTPDGLRLPDVLRDLQVMRSSTLANPSGIAALAGQHLALQVHLGHIIAYAETLAKSEDWDKAVRALDEAQQKTAAAAEKEALRGSVPLPAPLRRIGTAKEAGGVGDNFIVLNKGYENLLVRDDGGMSTSLLFASHGTPEPGSLMAGGPSTGMMIMDGAGLPGMSGTNTSLQPLLQSNSSAVTPRKALIRRTPSQQQHAMIYTTEKEVAVPVTTGRRGPEEEITEEALAFAQVPVHILGRLSLNLVGHVYTGTTTTTTTSTSTSSQNANEPDPGNASGTSDQTSYDQSLSTTKTEEEYFDDGASARTSDMGSLHDGDLQFSQLDHSKPPPAAAAAAMSRPLPPSQTTLVGSQASLRSQGTTAGSQQMQQQSIPEEGLHPVPLPQAPVPAAAPSQQPPPISRAPSSQQSLSSAPTPTPAPSQPVLVSHSQQQLQQIQQLQQQPQQQQQQPQSPPPTQPRAPRLPYPHHERIPSSSAQSSVYGPPPPPPPPPPGLGHVHGGHGHHGLREMRSISTMNTQTFINMQKPLPRTPLVYIPSYPGPFVKTKAVVVGNFSSGKTCLITRMSRGHYPRTKQDKCGITESVRLSIDEEPIELSLWDIRGIDYDPTWLNDAHVALVCFSVNIGSTDSKGKHLGRWVAEVNRNCPGAAILLVGLKSDIRFHARSVEKLHSRGKGLVTPEQGAMFRDNIGASRYLECSARTGDGVLEVLGETARVAVQVKRAQQLRKSGGGGGGRGGGEGGGMRPLSRIGRFLGIGGGKE